MEVTWFKLVKSCKIVILFFMNGGSFDLLVTQIESSLNISVHF